MLKQNITLNTTKHPQIGHYTRIVPLFIQNAVGVSPDNSPIPTFSTSLHPLSGIVPNDRGFVS
jgi:hypothetical protein